MDEIATVQTPDSRGKALMMLKNTGFLAKARKNAVNDIVGECMLDRFSIERNFGSSAIDTYLLNGRYARAKPEVEIVREKTKALEEPPSPLKQGEQAITFDQSRYKMHIPKKNMLTA